MTSPVPSDAVAAPLSCGAGHPARRPREATWKYWPDAVPAACGRWDPSRSTTLAHPVRRHPPVVAHKIGTRSNSSMDYGLVLFTSDRGISPAAAAALADKHGFHTVYVPG